MSSFHVIDTVNQRLRQLLFQSYTADLDVQQFFSSIDVIKLESPKETARQQSNRLSLFLYQITEDPHLKNRPPVASSGQSRFKPPPMALRLHYLITPFGPTAEANALIVGKTLEALYDNSTIVITDPVTGQVEDVRVIFETLDLEELTRVWEALQESYHISLAYQVHVSKLESGREKVVIPVGETEAAYAEEGP